MKVGEGKIHRELVAIPTFNWKMYVILTDDVALYSKSQGVKFSEEGTIRAACVYFPNRMECHIVLNVDSPPGHIAHESWHAVRHMLKYTGVGLKNEVVAYHLGYLVDHVHSVVKKYVAKKEKECHIKKAASSTSS